MAVQDLRGVTQVGGRTVRETASGGVNSMEHGTQLYYPFSSCLMLLLLWLGGYHSGAILYCYFSATGSIRNTDIFTIC